MILFFHILRMVDVINERVNKALSPELPIHMSLDIKSILATLTRSTIEWNIMTQSVRYTCINVHK